MKKRVKIILIITGIFIGIIILDTLQATIFKHSPLISWKDNLEDNDSWVDKGILIDTYYCTKEKDIISVSWKFKGSKFTCPIDNVDINELNNINNKIIEYFSSSNVEYDNLSFNYVDEENKVVVIGLINNNKEQQEKFKKLIIDSDLIKFVQGQINTNHNQSTENKTEIPTTSETDNNNSNTSNNNSNTSNNNQTPNNNQTNTNSNNNQNKDNSNDKTYTKEIVIDNYIGKNYVDVKTSLENKGLYVVVEKTTSSNAENTIVSQSITPGKYTVKIKDNKIIEGITTITLKIPKIVVVYPDFTNGNYTINDIKNFANNNGLTLSITTEQSELPSGTIISQSRNPGANVVSGTTLKITIAE